jgi:AraC family transcriptional regulator
MMNRSVRADQNPNVDTIGGGAYDPFDGSMPSVDFCPAEVIRQQTASWQGLQAKTVQLISHEPFEYSFNEGCHLLVAVEQGVRYDGETFIEGLPKSTIRNYTNKLIFVPAGRKFYGVQNPRLLTRSICLYIDPQSLPVDPDLRFAEADLKPGLLFEDPGLWETALKLKALIGSADPGDRMYGEALGGVLGHELLRLNGNNSRSQPIRPGGLAAWKQRRVIEFMEEHLAEDVSLSELASLVGLSPYHFLRAFKRSFGEPPHRHWTRRRIARAKAILADPRQSITEIAFDCGFSTSSAFGAAFLRISGQTPSSYRRNLE